MMSKIKGLEGRVKKILREEYALIEMTKAEQEA